MGITRHLGAFFGSSEKRDQLLIDLVRMSKQSMEKRIDHVLDSLKAADVPRQETPEPAGAGRKAKAFIIPAAVFLAFLLGIAFYYLYPHFW